MSEQERPANWRTFEESDHGATRTFGIAYDTGVGQHILCNRMYEWQADWLVKVLRQFCTREVPAAPYEGEAHDQ